MTQELKDQIAKRPTTLETTDTGDYYAVCNLNKENVLTIHSIAKGKKNGDWKFNVTWK